MRASRRMDDGFCMGHLLGSTCGMSSPRSCTPPAREYEKTTCEGSDAQKAPESRPSARNSTPDVAELPDHRLQRSFRDARDFELCARAAVGVARLASDP